MSALLPVSSLLFLLLTLPNNAVSSSVQGDASSSTGTAARYSNVTSGGRCWDQWTAYWSALSSSSIEYTTTTQTTVRTIGSASIYFGTSTRPPSTLTTTETYYETGALANHNAFATLTGLETEVYTLGGVSSFPTSTGPTVDRVTTEITTFDVAVTIVPNVTEPRCTLPAIVPQCQSEWSEWIAGGATKAYQPSCSQASVDAAQCSAAITAYYADVPVHGDLGIPGWVTSGSSTFWPTRRTFAPSCTLGCQKCAITGDNVQLLYWPASTATAVEDGGTTAFPLQQSANASGPRTALFGDTTLTSPTIYISYDTLYASDSCSGVGRTFKNTIIPVSSQGLSSLAYKPLSNWAIGPGQWGVGELSYEFVDRPFNLSDLMEPIPDSVFNQLPWCQRELRGLKIAGANASSFTCTPRDVAYAPLIAIPTEVRSLDPAWASCTAWYGGLFDPPKALQGAPAEATPTIPIAAQTTSASAGSIADPGMPSETAGSGQGSGVAPNSPSDTADAGDPSTSSSVSGGSSIAGGQTTSSPGIAAAIASAIGLVNTRFTAVTYSNAETAAVQTAASVVFTAGGQTYTAYQPSTSGEGLEVQGFEISTTVEAGSQAVVGGQTIDAATSGAFAVGTQVLAFDAAPMSISLADASDHISIGTRTVHSTFTSHETIYDAPSTGVIGGQSMTAEPHPSGLLLEDASTSVTLSAKGAAATIGTQVVSAAGFGDLVIGSETDRVIPETEDSANGRVTTSTSPPTTPATPLSTVMTMNGIPWTIVSSDNGVEMEAGSTSNTFAFLASGGPAVTIGNEIVSANASGQLTVSTKIETTSLPKLAESRQVLTLGSAVVTVRPKAGHSGEVAVGAQTLSANGPAQTISGHVVSEGSGGLVVDGTSTLKWSHSTTTGESKQRLTLGSAVVTARPVPGHTGEVAVDGQTLSVGGPALTVSGHVLSEGIGGLVVGRTSTLMRSSRAALPSILTAPPLASSSLSEPAPSSTTSGASDRASRYVHLVAAVTSARLLYTCI